MWHIFLCAILGALVVPIMPAQREALLAFDAHKMSGPLPAHFRTMQDAWVYKCRTGLEMLHASGSGQFSEEQVASLIRLFPSWNIIIVDLRQEAHGFVDGKAVSWLCCNNLINFGKEPSWIIADETMRLHAIGRAFISIVAHSASHALSEGKLENLKMHHLYVDTACTEQEMVQSKGLRYIRFTVTDKMLPTDADVDRFITLVESLKDQDWLHIHCRAGRGRTTTFLALYDMLCNASAVECEDIIRRQYRLGGVNFWEQPLRLMFLKKFYEYARARAQGFRGNWSAWQKII